MKRVLDSPDFPPDKYARGEDSNAIIIPSLPEDCAMRVILFSYSAPRCAQVCKSWREAAARCYEHIFAAYRRNPKINPFVPAGFSPYEAVKLTYRAVMDRTHAPHIDRRIANLCRSVPLFLSPVLATVEDVNLIHCFKQKLQPTILENERPVLKGTSAQQSSTIRDWVKNHSVFLNRIIGLDFTLLNLTTLPPEIFQCTILRKLELAYNKLTVLPPELFKCTTLRTLGLGHNKLVTFPPEIGNLGNLQYLDFSQNQLVVLPPEIGRLGKLETLNLGRNPLTTLPQIGQLRNLKTIHLPHGIQSGLREHPLRIGIFADLLALDRIQNAFNEKNRQEALEMFEKLPAETKDGVREELCKYDGGQEYAFFRLHGQDVDNIRWERAIENFIRR